MPRAQRRFRRRPRRPDRFCGYKGSRVSSAGENRTLRLGGGDWPENKGFPDNRVVTAKYTMLNFLPKNLFEQFRRIANFYFLCMSIVSLSIDGPVNPITSVAPLVFVVTVTMLKQGYEDWLRHRSDKEVNNAPVMVIRSGCAQVVRSQEVRVGDLVVVHRDEDVPCDMVLLSSSDPEGRCFLTTANLDGETNLKTLYSPRLLRYFSRPEQLAGLNALIECEQPHPDLYRYHGKIEVLPADDSVFASLLTPGSAGSASDRLGGVASSPSLASPDLPDSARPGPGERPAQPQPAQDPLEAAAAPAEADAGPQAAAAAAAAARPAGSDYSLASVRREDASAAAGPSPGPRKGFPPGPGPAAARGHRHTLSDGAASSHELGQPQRPASLGQVRAVRHSLAFGETVTHGRRSLKRIGLLIEGLGSPPGSGSASVASSELGPEGAASRGSLLETQPSTRSVRLSSVGERGAVPVRRCSVGLSAPLTAENLLLRGTRVRNTDVAYGCAVYTGRETKLALNSRLTSLKFSTVERAVNKFLIFFLVVLFLAVAMSLVLKYTLHFAWQSEYMDGRPEITAQLFIVDMLSFVLLYNYLIPISLYVTMEMQKFLGTFFFEWDLELYDDATGQPAQCNTSDLNEDLGQVQVLFTDKTGTLTENLMVFRRFTVAGVPYVLRDGRVSRLGSDMDEGAAEELDSLPVEAFFLVLALCHTVQLGEAGANNNYSPSAAAAAPDYQASSPDEKALVEAAAKIGIVFLGEEGDFVFVQVKGEVRRFRKLDVLEFTPERRRMSVVLEDERGRLWLHCKGAESSVLPLADEGPLHATQAHVNDFAMRGLRTMAVGSRRLERSAYLALGQEIEVARQTISSEREALVAASYERMERGLRLTGATGVEDRLQDGVQETLESLRAAGIKVWILTGDKVETAVNISFSCGHFKGGTEQLYLTDHTDREQCAVSLERIRERVRADPHRQYGLVVDGQSLSLAMRQPDALREVGAACTAVVCCRMSPLQKCEVVQLIKASQERPVTAAIGDGANDVSMIQEAHVGLGIMGREGRQAVRCSDFAFARFKMTRRVLLVHGHWYYERITTLVQYFFYKNVIFIAPQLYYAFYNAFSTQPLYVSMFLMLYNVLFTSLPVLLYGLTEQVHSARQLMAYPQLYRRIARNVHMRWRAFGCWMSYGLWHSLVLFFLPLLLLSANPNIHYNNRPIENVEFGTIVFHSVVVVANLKLLLHSGYWTMIFISSIILSVVGFIAVTLVYCSIKLEFLDTTMYMVYNSLLMSPIFWIISFLTVTLCLLPDLSFATFEPHMRGGICRRRHKKS